MDGLAGRTAQSLALLSTEPTLTCTFSARPIGARADCWPIAGCLRSTRDKRADRRDKRNKPPAPIVQRASPARPVSRVVPVQRRSKMAASTILTLLALCLAAAQGKWISRLNFARAATNGIVARQTGTLRHSKRKRRTHRLELKCFSHAVEQSIYRPLVARCRLPSVNGNRVIVMHSIPLQGIEDSATSLGIESDAGLV